MDQQKKLIVELVSNIVSGAHIKEAESKIEEYESQPGNLYIAISSKHL